MNTSVSGQKMVNSLGWIMSKQLVNASILPYSRYIGFFVIAACEFIQVPDMFADCW